jgi:trehalose/maltose hydrolase-like predicted phosphorylase
VNFDYYSRRTSHGSTLSNLVHAYLASLLGYEQLTWKFYTDALMSDYKDVQMGTTKEGIHVGVMAGSAVLTLRAFAGLRLDGEHVRIAPNLPKTWRKLRFNLGFKGDRYEFELYPSKVNVKLSSQSKDTVEIGLGGQKLVVENDHWKTLELN